MVIYFSKQEGFPFSVVLQLRCTILLDLAPACSKSVSIYGTVKAIYNEYQKFINLIRSIFFSGVFYHFKQVTKGNGDYV